MIDMISLILIEILIEIKQDYQLCEKWIWKLSKNTTKISKDFKNYYFIFLSIYKLLYDLESSYLTHLNLMD